jgi:hypothetical protein
MNLVKFRNYVCCTEEDHCNNIKALLFTIRYILFIMNKCLIVTLVSFICRYTEKLFEPRKLNQNRLFFVILTNI